MPIPTPQERLGQLINGRYRLESLLSTGGMGVLFRGLDVGDGTAVAVKTLKPAYALEPERVARFLRETSIAERVQHPNVARMLDASIDDSGAPFLILELLDGHTLEQELARRGTLALNEAVTIALPIMCALDAAHALGVVHRDVKPSNIFLSSVGPKLLDFGIAKSGDAVFETQTGMFIGSPGYVAPEQALYADCSPETDVWAMGAVLYRCLSGHPPHMESADGDLFGRLVRDPVPPLTAAGVSKRACATIERALARDPHRRYPSMQAFARALEELVRAEPSADTGELALAGDVLQPMAAMSLASRRRRPGVKGVVIAATLTCISASVGPSMIREPAPALATAKGKPDSAAQPRLPFEDRALIAALGVNEADERAPEPDERAQPPKSSPSVSTRSVKVPQRAIKQDTVSNVEQQPEPAERVVSAPIEHEATSGLPVVTEW